MTVALTTCADEDTGSGTAEELLRSSLSPGLFAIVLEGSIPAGASAGTDPGRP